MIVRFFALTTFDSTGREMLHLKWIQDHIEQQELQVNLELQNAVCLVLVTKLKLLCSSIPEKNSDWFGIKGNVWLLFGRSWSFLPPKNYPILSAELLQTYCSASTNDF